MLPSPYSPVESFSMILGGARGETERVLFSVLGLEGCSGKDADRERAKLREALKALDKDLESPLRSPMFSGGNEA
ncbi:hypothetical protein [Thermatribacter velox]|uniref:hypothetical protein n=1 Tax=Thermatribacter velox TaxID=3039681 RepID=UPI0034D95CF4